LATSLRLAKVLVCSVTTAGIFMSEAYMKSEVKAKKVITSKPTNMIVTLR